jgi:hypothetical protein
MYYNLEAHYEVVFEHVCTVDIVPLIMIMSSIKSSGSYIPSNVSVYIVVPE